MKPEADQLIYFIYEKEGHCSDFKGYETVFMYNVKQKYLYSFGLKTHNKKHKKNKKITKKQNKKTRFYAGWQTDDKTFCWKIF